MVAHAYLTELFGCALEDGFCELEFAARCRAWAKKRYAEQQERDWLPEESYVEIDEYNSVCKKGDKVLVVKGQLTGSTGVLCREVALGSSRFLDVRIKSFPHSLCSCPVKAEGRLRQQISKILDERDSDGEMSLNALIASLLEGGMLARQGGAGREQRKNIKDLACSMILEHNEKGFELFQIVQSKSKKGRCLEDLQKRWHRMKNRNKDLWEKGQVPGEPPKRKWPSVFDGVTVKPTVRLKLGDVFFLRCEEHLERFQCNAIELDSLANPALPGTACRESGHCECQEEWDFLVEDDESFIFNKILRPAFARAVCAALAISPFKIADEKVLSFAMSQHSRLGKRSCAFGLPSEIISRIVFASESLDRFDEAKHFGTVVHHRCRQDDPFISLAPISLERIVTARGHGEYGSDSATFVCVKSSVVHRQIDCEAGLLVSNAICTAGDHSVDKKDEMTLQKVVSELGLQLSIEKAVGYKTILSSDCGHW